ncbi:hypothetical protein P7K49_029164 [Saguinus oedipus]|uniref:Uncharacterized protein n=1 Tax=Saguinus oedipus TaxID=9490 RepID=A0ABQ9U7B6_SAGOE|nr:hypothetical protein P7K49_029164 [Saguinus oedipus]
MNHQHCGQGPHAQSGPVGDPVPAVLSWECFFRARKVSPSGSYKAFGIKASSLVPPHIPRPRPVMFQGTSWQLPSATAAPQTSSSHILASSTSMALKHWDLSSQRSSHATSAFLLNTRDPSIMTATSITPSIRL